MVQRLYHVRAVAAARRARFLLVRCRYGAPGVGVDVEAWGARFARTCADDLVRGGECRAVAGAAEHVNHKTTESYEYADSHLQRHLVTTPQLLKLISPSVLLVSGEVAGSTPVFQVWLFIAGFAPDLLDEPDLPYGWRYSPFANGSMNSCGFLVGSWGLRGRDILASRQELPRILKVPPERVQVFEYVEYSKQAMTCRCPTPFSRGRSPKG